MQNSEKPKSSTAKPKQRRGGLGRGLESLISSAPTSPPPSFQETTGAEANGLKYVPIDDIQPNPWQPRLHLNQEQLEELSASIRTHGVMQPLVVNQADEPGSYTLIAGERRWRASRLAGLTEVPVVVMDASPQTMLELAIVENVVRADLSPMEEAQAYKKLIEDFQLTQGEVADRVGKSRVAITNTLRLLNAPEQVQESLVRGEITEGHARAMLGLTSLPDQIEMLEHVRAKGLSVRQTEQQVRNWVRKPKQKEFERPEIDPETVRIESKLRDALGTRVTLRRNPNSGGSIHIEYFSDEQLQAICDRLMEEEMW